MIFREECQWYLTLQSNTIIKWLHTKCDLSVFTAHPKSSRFLPVVWTSCAQKMAGVTDGNGTELPGKNGTLKSNKFSKFRITVEPLGFLYLTANIIQVICYWLLFISFLTNHGICILLQIDDCHTQSVSSQSLRSQFPD